MAFLVTWMVLAGIMSLVARSFCDKPLAWRKHTHTHSSQPRHRSSKQEMEPSKECDTKQALVWQRLIFSERKGRQYISAEFLTRGDILSRATTCCGFHHLAGLGDSKAKIHGNGGDLHGGIAVLVLKVADVDTCRGLLAGATCTRQDEVC